MEYCQSIVRMVCYSGLVSPYSFSCSEEREEPSINASIVGNWKLTSMQYEGLSKFSVGGQNVEYSFSGVASDLLKVALTGTPIDEAKIIKLTANELIMEAEVSKSRIENHA